MIQAGYMGSHKGKKKNSFRIKNKYTRVQSIPEKVRHRKRD
jgi:hypothetical protein